MPPYSLSLEAADTYVCKNHLKLPKTMDRGWWSTRTASMCMEGSRWDLPGCKEWSALWGHLSWLLWYQTIPVIPDTIPPALQTSQSRTEETQAWQTASSESTSGCFSGTPGSRGSEQAKPGLSPSCKKVLQDAKAVKEFDIHCIKQECAHSFWKFANKVWMKTRALHRQPPSDLWLPHSSDTLSRNFQFPAKVLWSSCLASSTQKPTMSLWHWWHTTRDAWLQAIHKASYSSSPSPVGQIPYSISKRCPTLFPALFDIYSLCWKSSQVPSPWKIALINLIPKKACRGGPSQPGNFWPITLTSCIGKLLTTILKSRLLSFMSTIGYLDSNMPSCSRMCRTLHQVSYSHPYEAHTCHKFLAVRWRDLANANGNVHHNLISFSLRYYNSPPQFVYVVL